MTMHHGSEKINHILASAEFAELISERRKLRFSIALVNIVAYFSFILMVAFEPAVLGKTIGTGVVSIGIYLGLALLVFGFLLTGLYMRFSDGKIADLQDQIRRKF